ncbi:MAG: DedA family protein [Alistipes senegalensis]|nr:DedA family protein [Oxalobacter formigenes]MCM1281993.1 DedA family protein [Alistipes senegalensis]
MIESAVYWLLGYLAVPEIGLTSVFILCFVSATLLPMGSEPAVFAVIAADASLFWPVMAVATAGNTLGGVLNYWIGLGTREAFAREKQQTRLFGWLSRYGAKTMLFSWLPGIGDPLCTLAGWLRLPFWPSVFYMAAGKFLRYLVMTTLLLRIPASYWRNVAGLLG